MNKHFIVYNSFTRNIGIPMFLGYVNFISIRTPVLYIYMNILRISCIMVVIYNLLPYIYSISMYKIIHL